MLILECPIHWYLCHLILAHKVPILYLSLVVEYLAPRRRDLGLIPRGGSPIPKGGLWVQSLHMLCEGASCPGPDPRIALCNGDTLWGRRPVNYRFRTVHITV